MGSRSSQLSNYWGMQRWLGIELKTPRNFHFSFSETLLLKIKICEIYHPFFVHGLITTYENLAVNLTLIGYRLEETVSILAMRSLAIDRRTTISNRIGTKHKVHATKWGVI